jgi:hypothetical protein
MKDVSYVGILTQDLFESSALPLGAIQIIRDTFFTLFRPPLPPGDIW